MIKEFIERIGQVIRKMLGREKIKDAIGVEVAVSDKMANGIDLIYIPLCLYFNPSSPSLFIFFLFHPLSVDLSIAINILPYFSCFFYKIDGKCPIYRVF